MDGLILLALAAFVVGWHWFVHVKSGGRSHSPLWGAFTATFVAILFVVAGAVGYELNHGVPFANPSAWSGTVLWPQIGVGAGAAIVAVYFWRVGLRQLRATL